MPQIRIRDQTGTLRTVTRIRMRDQTGTLQTIQRIRMRDQTNTLRTVYQYLSVTLDTYYEYQSDSGPAATGSVTSDTITGTPTGGTAPYTYLWEYVSGPLSVGPIDASLAATEFGGVKSGGAVADPTLFRLKVTDLDGAIAYSDPVTIELEWFDTR